MIEVEFIKEKRSKNVCLKAVIRRDFVGGDSQWLKSFEKGLTESLHFDRRIKKGKYIVSVQFSVSGDGMLSDIRVLNDPGFQMAEQVVRVPKKGMIFWRPGGQDGRPILPYRRSVVTDSISNYYRR